MRKAIFPRCFSTPLCTFVGIVTLACSGSDETSGDEKGDPLALPPPAGSGGGSADDPSSSSGGDEGNGAGTGGISPGTGGNGEGAGGTGTTEPDPGVLPPGYVPLNLSFEYFDVNPRDGGADDCSVYDTSDAFRTFFNEKRGQMDLIATLFSRIMGRAEGAGDANVVMEIHAFDYDFDQGERDSCTEVSSPGEGTRGTTYGDILGDGEIFMDYEPDPLGFRGVCLLAHETLHGLGSGHDPDDDGLMAPTIFPEDRFFDSYILGQLRAAQIELVDDLSQRIDDGETISMEELVSTYLGIEVNGDNLVLP